MDMTNQLNTLFVDPEETPVAVIGNSYLQNFLATGHKLKKGYGILTQRRFYYRGQNWGWVGRAATTDTEVGVVALEDITYTMFTHNRNIGALIFGILLAVLGTIIGAASAVGEQDAGIGAIIAATGITLGIVFILTYLMSRKSLFLVSFPGGGFSFNITWYSAAEFQTFQRQLHLLKDQRKAAWVATASRTSAAGI